MTFTRVWNDEPSLGDILPSGAIYTGWLAETKLSGQRGCSLRDVRARVRVRLTAKPSATRPPPAAVSAASSGPLTKGGIAGVVIGCANATRSTTVPLFAELRLPHVTPGNDSSDLFTRLPPFVQVCGRGCDDCCRGRGDGESPLLGNQTPSSDQHHPPNTQTFGSAEQPLIFLSFASPLSSSADEAKARHGAKEGADSS